MKTKGTHFSPTAASRWQFAAMAAMLSLAALGLSACGGGGSSPADAVAAAASGGNNGGGAADDPVVAAAAQAFFAFTPDVRLWKTDGTEAGTFALSDIEPGTASDAGDGLTLFNGSTYFTGRNGLGLWKTNGTQDGTVLLKDVYVVSRFIQLNGALYFTATEGGLDGTNLELWKTDGTAAGTVLVKDILPGAFASFPRLDQAVLFNGALYFIAESGDDLTTVSGLWKTDGTTVGTVLVKESLDADNFKVFNGALYFSARGSNGSGLWKTDGTTAGTVLVKSLFSPRVDSDSVVFNGALYFSAEDGITTNSELWKTDGTTAGTVLVKDINPPDGFGSASSPRNFTLFNGAVYFSADDGSHGRELWKTDGTAAGTVLVKDIRPGVDGGLDFNMRPTVLNGALYFAADDGRHGVEIWVTDGTEAGTVLLNDVYPGIGNSVRDGDNGPLLKLVNGTLYFTAATSSIKKPKLWMTDGTPAGTVLLSDSRDLNDIDNLFVQINEVPYFIGEDAAGRLGLWKTDGTPTGTVLVKDIDSVSGSIKYGYFEQLQGGRYFQTFSSGGDSISLWKTDGTTAGTVLVKTFN